MTWTPDSGKSTTWTEQSSSSAWSAIADKSSTWAITEQPDEKIDDPGFDDADKWKIIGSFTTKVEDGKLKIINQAAGFILPDPQIAAVVGDIYTYEIVVSEYPSPSTARIAFGDTEIYNKDGAGTFTGRFTPASINGLVIFPSLLGRWVIDRISIKSVTGWTILPVNATTFSDIAKSAITWSGMPGKSTSYSEISDKATSWSSVSKNTTSWS